MLEPVQNKEEGWQNWLQKYQIYDPEKSEDELYLRYMKLKDVKFPLVQEEYWHLLFKDLVNIEGGLVYGDCIGCCGVLPFQFDVEGTEKIRQKPIMYPKEARDWVNQYVAKQVELGVMTEVVRGRDPEPMFICNVVLVKEGQSQQDYRFCGNFVPANYRMTTPAQPMVDCQTTLDSLEGSTVLSSVDIKGAFLNVVVREELKTFLGIITQDGLYQYNRMPFGTTASACHFQSLMSHLLRDICRALYLDDCTFGDNYIENNWRNVMEAMTRLINAGLPINIKKCQFLVASIKLLGYLLCANSVQLGKKSIQKLFGSAIPRTRTQLQALLGKLNFASIFLPNYRQIVAPIMGLLKSNSSGKWTTLHTDRLNDLAALIMKRVKLGLVNSKQGVTVYVDENEGFINSILAQGEGEDFTICAFAHRELIASEVKLPRIERLFIAALWAIKKFQRYTFVTPKITVSLPDEAELHVATFGSSLSPRLQAKLIELSAFQCSFTSSFSANELLHEVSNLQEECNADSSQEVELKCWEHEDITIPQQGSKTGGSKIQDEHLLLQFDGGCQQKRGTGGCVLWDQQKKLIGGRYFYYGTDRGTNNKAEAQALLDGLRYALAQPIPEGITQLVVQGDSALVISFMQGHSKPGEPRLIQIINEAKVMVKKQKLVQIIFQHIPRSENQWADMLTRAAAHNQGDGVMQLENIDLHSKIPLPTQDLCATMFASDGPGHSHCEECKQVNGELECWTCGKFFHHSCTGDNYPTRRGPWHCQKCKEWHEHLGTRDILLDEPLLRYLSHEEVPTSTATAARVLKTSKWIHMDDRGSLWSHALKIGPPRRIPAFYERKDIIYSVLSQTNYPSGQSAYQLIRVQFYWSGMLADCLAIAASTLVRQKARAKFKIPPYIKPPNKGCYPFSIWAVDTIVNMTPASPTGATSIILAVDAFTKWIELGVLQNLNSHETTIWFHDHISCRYGTPFLVRSDRGSEYRGRFHRYMQLAGIAHRYISTMNPRANGQAERMVRAVKEGLVRCLESCPDARWWEVLGDIARGLRMTPSRATGHSPYYLVFKNAAPLPILHQLQTLELSSEDLLSPEPQEAAQAWQQIFADVQMNQLRYDTEMVREYKKRKTLADHDIRFLFEPGDPCLLKSKEPGKLKCRAVGPYTFVAYNYPDGLTAKVQNQKGKVYTVSSANLLPLRTDGPIRELKFDPGWDLDHQPPQSSESLMSDSDEQSVAQQPVTPFIQPI